MTESGITVSERMHDPSECQPEESLRVVVIKCALSIAAAVLVWIVVLAVTL